MTFSACCTHCETEVLSDVVQLSDAELARMRDHLRACAPSLTTDRLREVGALLHLTSRSRRPRPERGAARRELASAAALGARCS